MLHRKADRRDYIGMEFHRFLTNVVLIPAMVIRRARSITIRSITIRIIGYHPELDRFYSTWRTIESTAFS